MKRIFFCNRNGIYPYHMSGAEVSIDELLREISFSGHEVVALTCIERYLLYHNDYDALMADDLRIERDVYTKYILTSTNNYTRTLTKLLREYNPDIVFTQFFEVSQIKELVKNKVPVVCFIHGSLSSSDFCRYEGADLYVCVSNYLASILPDNVSNVHVIYPIIKRENCVAEAMHEQRDKILFVNPIKSKGVEIVFDLAKKFNSEKFLIYENWRGTHKKYLDIIAFLDNVSLRAVSSNTSDIYRNVKLLLFPSQIDEGFGRCIVEANFNSIPVIASKVGGILESAGTEQLLVEDYTNIFAWECALMHILSNKKYYNSLVEKARINSKRFEETSISRFIDVLHRLM